jgi:hypothetical protein
MAAWARVTPIALAVVMAAVGAAMALTMGVVVEANMLVHTVHAVGSCGTLRFGLPGSSHSELWDFGGTDTCWIPPNPSLPRQPGDARPCHGAAFRRVVSGGGDFRLGRP